MFRMPKSNLKATLESSFYQRVAHTLQRHKPTTLLRLSDVFHRGFIHEPSCRSTDCVLRLGSLLDRESIKCNLDMKYMLIVHVSQAHAAVKSHLLHLDVNLPPGTVTSSTRSSRSNIIFQD